MYGIFGENRSDFETLKEIVRKLKGGDRSLPIRGEGFGGSGNLLKAGSRALRLYYESGFRRFIICTDADGRDPEEVRRDVENRVVKPAGLGADALPFVAVPVQMIEAWILADIESAAKMFKSWRPGEVRNPDAIPNPKHELKRLSQQGLNQPRYDRTEYNPKIIAHLDLDRVAKKCPSFKCLHDFVLRK